MRGSAVCDIKTYARNRDDLSLFWPTLSYWPTGHAIGGTAQLELRSSSTAAIVSGPRHYHRTLKLKLRLTVTVAKSCAQVLENERAETGEKIRKLDWALLLELSAHHCLKENPLGHQLGPTREEVQERLAKERERVARWEHKGKVAIEQELRKKIGRQDRTGKGSGATSQRGSGRAGEWKQTLGTERNGPEARATGPRRLWLYREAANLAAQSSDLG